MSCEPKYLRTIQNKSVVTTVIDRITTAIIEGELKPGDKIPTEMELVDSIGVSRNSIREAIKVLEFMGVLEIRHAEGTYIASGFNTRIFNPLLYGIILQSNSTRSMFQFRRMFDIGTLLLAVDTATEEHIAHCHKCFEEYARAMRCPMENYEYLVDLDIAYHNSFRLATENELIIHTGQIIDQITRYSRIHSMRDYIQKGEVEKTLSQHRRLLTVLEQRDSKGVSETLSQCIDHWRQHL